MDVSNSLKSQPTKAKGKSVLAKIPPSVARILTAVVLLPILIASIVVAKLALLFAILGAAAILLGLIEFWILAKKQQIRVDVTAGLLSAVALLTIFYYTQPNSLPDLLMIQLVVLLLTAGALTAAMVRGAPFDRMIASAGATVLSVMYVVLLGGHLLAVRIGFAPILSKHLRGFFFLVLMGSDSAVYDGGILFCRHKLASNVSPGKTWEG